MVSLQQLVGFEPSQAVLLARAFYRTGQLDPRDELLVRHLGPVPVGGDYATGTIYDHLHLYVASPDETKWVLDRVPMMSPSEYVGYMVHLQLNRLHLVRFYLEPEVEFHDIQAVMVNESEPRLFEDLTVTDLGHRRQVAYPLSDILRHPGLPILAYISMRLSQQRRPTTYIQDLRDLNNLLKLELNKVVGVPPAIVALLQYVRLSIDNLLSTGQLLTYADLNQHRWLVPVKQTLTLPFSEAYKTGLEAYVSDYAARLPTDEEVIARIGTL